MTVTYQLTIEVADERDTSEVGRQLVAALRDVVADGGASDVEDVELLMLDVCKHLWEEQPGEPPVDVCPQCGKVRR